MKNREDFAISSPAEEEILLERARSLAREEKTDQKNLLEVLTFFLCGKSYFFDVRWAAEVVAPPPITPIPYGPSFLVGAINLRGEIITITDLEDFLGLGRGKRDQECLLLLEGDHLKTGILVDEVWDCRFISKDSMEEPLSTLQEEQKAFLVGTASIDGRAYACLDMEAILNDQRLIVDL